MKSDRLWNEIRTNMTLEQPSDTFTDKVMDAVQTQQQQLHAAYSAQKSANDTRLRTIRSVTKRQYMMNALLASAATFLFVATGVWSSVIDLQSGAFSMTIQNTVSHTIYYGIELLSEALYRL